MPVSQETSMGKDAEDGRQLKTLQKAFDIVQSIQAYDGARLTDLANEHDMTKGTVHTYLNTLQSEGLVQRAENEYNLSLKWFEFGSRIRDQEPLYRFGKEPADTLAQRCGELIYLAVEQGALTYFIYPAKGENASDPATPVGRVRPLHCVSAGKAILANMSDSRRERILKEYPLEAVTKKTIVNREDFLEEIDAISRQGYAINDEEELLGSRSVATSISDPGGGIAGAISVSGPKTRFDDDHIEKMVPMLKETANQIEINFQRENY